MDLNSLLGFLRGKQGVFGPPRYTTWDWAEAQQSITALAALEPQVLATGHGPRQVDGSAKLEALCRRLGRPARWRQGMFAGVDCAMLQGFDLVTLTIAAPVLGLALWQARRGSRRGTLVCVGMLAYSVYTVPFYLFGTSFHDFFWPHVALFVA